jgi:hypothetical protein
LGESVEALWKGRGGYGVAHQYLQEDLPPGLLGGGGAGGALKEGKPTLSSHNVFAENLAAAFTGAAAGTAVFDIGRLAVAFPLDVCVLRSPRSGIAVN